MPCARAVSAVSDAAIAMMKAVAMVKEVLQAMNHSLEEQACIATNQIRATSH
jgi:hypothetical protein